MVYYPEIVSYVKVFVRLRAARIYLYGDTVARDGRDA
jgi:hypothetical protein